MLVGAGGMDSNSVGRVGMELKSCPHADLKFRAFNAVGCVIISKKFCFKTSDIPVTET